jgi:cation-transporting ATPase 13A2
MGLLSLIGLAWTIYNYMEEDAEGSDLALACLDMITIIIPPALPTCMSVGVAFALSRLFFENL